MEALDKKWGSKKVTGEEEVEKPSLLGFRNVDKACDFIHKHLKNGSKGAVHFDVDTDGIFSGYIIYKVLKALGLVRIRPVINKNKSHGITHEQVDILNKLGLDFFIIVDSGSNDIEAIKRLNMDVLVMDHHELEHDELYVKDGFEKIIVNNMAENLEVEGINEWIREKKPSSTLKLEPYSVEHRMSGALVVYETLRVYMEVYGDRFMLPDMKLDQCVAITLYSDVVKMVGDRNQWYVQQLLGVEEIEPTLKILLNELNGFSRFYSKSFVLFTLSPMINKSIRAGDSNRVLDIILNRPQEVEDLRVNAQKQAEIVERAMRTNIEQFDSFILADVSDLGVNRNYCGIIASNMCGTYGKNTVAYLVKNGYAEGSFRGRDGLADYKSVFNSVDEDDEDVTYGRGHKGAFGFRARIDQLPELMKKLEEKENISGKKYLTLGSIEPGEYHIEDVKKFKREYELMKLAVGNSRVSSEEQVLIHVQKQDVMFVEKRGEVWIYDVCGLKCKAFEEIYTPYCTIYAEFQDNVEIYLRNTL